MHALTPVRHLGKQGPRRGATIVEFLVSMFLMSIVLTGTARLFYVGYQQQRQARGYSNAQKEIREGLRRMTRALRHGYGVVNPSSSAGFPAADSGASQVIVRVPEPSGASTTDIEFRFHVSGEVLYYQRSDEAAPGTALVSGVQSAVFNYYQSSGSGRTAVDSTPASANEVQVTLTAESADMTTKVSTLVNLRNATVGSF
jgi:Tfp pilus assembly protein PilW